MGKKNSVLKLNIKIIFEYDSYDLYYSKTINLKYITPQQIQKAGNVKFY
jgi:hypothetical protein